MVPFYHVNSDKTVLFLSSIMLASNKLPTQPWVSHGDSFKLKLISIVRKKKKKKESGRPIDGARDAGTTIMSQRVQYAETTHPALVLAASCSLQAVVQALDWFPKFFLLEM